MRKRNTSHPVQVGVVSGWTPTQSGYQRTVIDGHEYLTAFDVRDVAVRRGSRVEYTVGAAPSGRSLPFAEILRVVGAEDRHEPPLSREVRVGRRRYTVTREALPAMRHLYTALEETPLDKVALRGDVLRSRLHDVVVLLDDRGRVRQRVGSGDYAPSSRGLRPLGQVTSRRAPVGADDAFRADLRREALAAIEAAYGREWRDVESRAGGDVVARE